MSKIKNCVQSQETDADKKTMRKERSDRIDRELFHVWLWDNRGRNDILALSGSEIARQLHLSRQTPVRLFGELVSIGKLIKTKRGYQVVDPKLF